MDNRILCFMSIVAYILVPAPKVSMAVDSILQSHFLSDGTTLVSQGGTFELGFFTPGNSSKRYLGIWYKKIPDTVVWVANSLTPINDSSGVLRVNRSGNLVLTQNDTVVWYTTSRKLAQDAVAVLLDSGNFVVRDQNEANPEDYLWQSFDYPSNTFLPGMKLGKDLRTGLNRRITAWKSPDDPSPGGFSWELVLHNYSSEFFIMKESDKFIRFGPWNGLYFSGFPFLKSTPFYDDNYVSSKDEVYYTYSVKDNSLISRYVVNQKVPVSFQYVTGNETWSIYKLHPTDQCEIFGVCGAFGNCNINESPYCQCLKGFMPKSTEAWNSMNFSQGCVRNKPLNCSNKSKDEFIKLVGFKVPDTQHTWVDEKMDLDLCKEKCLNDCSCMAYTNSDVRGTGSGCVMWFGDLIDIRQFKNEGQDLYIRTAASELVNHEEEEHGSKKKLKIIVATVIAAISGLLLLGLGCYYYIHQVQKNLTEKSENKEGDPNGGGVDGLDLPLLDLSMLAIATDNFSIENKIGEGGFGPVYRGKLVDGQKIAVKRLSRSSGQGMTEFKNEVKFIAKLQHRNLVKLLGCCIHGEEKMLVYEYMPNSSLDCFIFDDTKCKVLDWPKRFHIICGIARGLLYLHQDSRLRIIHRDLKASNVLLDDKLNPKISDFGIARTFGGDQTEGNTKRVVGTYGYMAPEYAVDGFFSVKSDVFSFGILLLEIICGKRSRRFYLADSSLNLVGHAWCLWKEGKALELIDSHIGDSCIIPEVLRCIHVGLLCVQQYPEDRPTMPSVFLMLGSENELAEPKEPGFFIKKDSIETNSSRSQVEVSLTNKLTITLLEGR